MVNNSSERLFNDHASKQLERIMLIEAGVLPGSYPTRGQIADLSELYAEGRLAIPNVNNPTYKIVTPGPATPDYRGK